MGLDRSDSAYYIRPRTEAYKIRTRRTEGEPVFQPENVIEEDLGTVAQRIKRLQSLEDDSFSGHDISGTWRRRKRTQSTENLDKLDTLETKIHQNASVSTVELSESQNDHPSSRTGSSSSNTSSKKENRYIVEDAESATSSSSSSSESEDERKIDVSFEKKGKSVESSFHKFYTDSEEESAKVDKSSSENEDQLKVTFEKEPKRVEACIWDEETASDEQSDVEVSFQQAPKKVESSFWDEETASDEKSEAGDENVFHNEKSEFRAQKPSEPDSIAAPLTSASTFCDTTLEDETTTTNTTGFLLKTTTVFTSDCENKEGLATRDIIHTATNEDDKDDLVLKYESSAPGTITFPKKQTFGGVEECFIEFEDPQELKERREQQKQLKITTTSRKVEAEVESEPEFNFEETKQVHSRVKLKGSDDENNKSPKLNQSLTANMTLQGYTTGFTDGESTHDELGDTIQRHSIFIYKGQNPTWRVGPILNDPRCWLSSSAEGDYESFMKGEKQCRSFHYWMEFGRGGWVRSGIFSIREYGFGAQNLGHCNGTFNAAWKSKVIPGIYDRKVDENGDYYFERTAFAKGTPSMAGIVDGESSDLPPLMMREKVTVRSSADFLVEKSGRVDFKPKDHAPIVPAEDAVDGPGLQRGESFKREEMRLNSDSHDIEKRVPYYLYKHSNCWKIGQTAGAARAVLMTLETDFRKLDRAKWIEVERNTRNSKKMKDSQVLIKKHPFAHNLVQIEASLRSQEPISGIYYELEDQENVWKLTTSIYVTGKFATEWKNATLPGWYDRIGPEIFMSRHLNETDKQEIFIYKKSGRWHVGPDPREKICWLFSGKNERHLHEQTRWFEADQGQKWIRNRSITAALRH